MKTQIHLPSKSEFKLRALSFSEIDARLISAWEDLENRALEPNAFLSPNFVIPALKYLENPSEIFAVFIEKVSSGMSMLTGVSLFKFVKPYKQFPFLHLKAFFTLYSYLSGFLIDREYANETMEVLFEFLCRSDKKWSGLFLEEHAIEGSLYKIEHEKAQKFNMKWYEKEEWHRAALHPAELPDGINSLNSQNVKKTIRRRTRRLEEAGSADWKVRYTDSLSNENLDEFLRLEHLGWKGEQGTSLHSKSKDVAFFKEMMTNFNRTGKALVGELMLNQKIISSQTVLVSENTAFCFKIGWDVDYFKYSPGYLNVSKWLEIKKHIPFELSFIDSGSDEGATYMNELWPHRRRLTTGIYATKWTGKLFLDFLNIKAKFKKTSKVND